MNKSNTEQPKYTVVIADDHMIVRNGIKQIINLRPHLRLVGEASQGIEAISLIKCHKPDIIFLDVSMPYANALEVYLEAKRWSPSSRVIVFTGMNFNTQLQTLVNEGIDALVSKNCDDQDIAKAIDAVLSGERYLDPAMLKKDSLNSEKTLLTKREHQILQLVLRGYTSPEIAENLSISYKTVDNHRTNLMKKLGVHSISELMTYALREGLWQLNEPC